MFKYSSSLPHIKSVRCILFHLFKAFCKILNIYFIEHGKYFTLVIPLKIIKDARISSAHGLVGLSDCLSSGFLGGCLSRILECEVDLESKRSCNYLERTLKGPYISSNPFFSPHPAPAVNDRKKTMEKVATCNGKMGNHKCY